MKLTLGFSPTGLVHIIQMAGGLWTNCGKEVNRETWTRINQFDDRIGGLMPSSIAKLVELPKCDRCFK